MERRGNKVDIVQRVSCWISDMAFARFKSFSDRVLGIQIDEIPTVESILMRQNFSVVFVMKTFPHKGATTQPVQGQAV